MDIVHGRGNFQAERKTSGRGKSLDWENGIEANHLL